MQGPRLELQLSSSNPLGLEYLRLESGMELFVFLPRPFSISGNFGLDAFIIILFNSRKIEGSRGRKCRAKERPTFSTRVLHDESPMSR